MWIEEAALKGSHSGVYRFECFYHISIVHPHFGASSDYHLTSGILGWHTFLGGSGQLVLDTDRQSMEASKKLQIHEWIFH